MDKANLFILTPETAPIFTWINNIDNLIDEQNAISFIAKIKSFKENIKNENYDAYYDDLTLNTILENFEILDESFPFTISRRLKSLFLDFFKWRENLIQLEENSYSIFNQKIENHTLCEISQRKHDVINDKFAIVNQDGIALNSSIDITINKVETKQIDILETKDELITWFSNNRIPKRNFQAIPKHNIKTPKKKGGELISPLLCNETHAEIILKTAIGVNSRELFGYDKKENMVIVFKYENKTPQNQYHGYHVDINSDEIPSEIDKELRTKHKY